MKKEYKLVGKVTIPKKKRKDNTKNFISGWNKRKRNHRN